MCNESSIIDPLQGPKYPLLILGLLASQIRTKFLIQARSSKISCTVTTTPCWLSLNNLETVKAVTLPPHNYHFKTSMLNLVSLTCSRCRILHKIQTVQSLIYNTALVIRTFYLAKTEKRIKASITQPSYYCFELRYCVCLKTKRQQPKKYADARKI